MAIAYKSAGAGASSETSGAAVSPASPATVDANDILIIHAYFEGTATAPSTPSGFTLLDGPRVIESTIGRHWIYGKIAAGTEDGAANALGSAAVTTMRSGRCYSFSGWVSGAITDLVVGFSATSHATDPQMPSVTTTIAGGLAVACIAQNDNNTAASATGESGGDWVEAVAEYTAALTPGLMLQLQTCTPTGNPGTVSGGSVATTNDPCGVIGFEIRPSLPIFTLTADSANVPITGTAATLARKLTLTAASASVPITGSAATTKRVLTLTAESANVPIAGTAATLLNHHKVAADTGNVPITGTAAAVGRKLTLAASSGNIPITGTDATLTYEQGAATLTAESGSVPITGTTATLARKLTLAADAGGVPITGTAATLARRITLTAESGSVPITGTAAGLRTNRRVAADSGNVPIAGTVATLLYHRKVAANTASVPITGTDATLTYEQAGATTLVADPGSVPINGSAATLKRIITVVAASGNIPINGTAATLKRIISIVAVSGSVPIGGTAATLRRLITLVAQAGNVPIGGTAANLVFDGGGESGPPPATIFIDHPIIVHFIHGVATVFLDDEGDIMSESDLRILRQNEVPKTITARAFTADAYVVGTDYSTITFEMDGVSLGAATLAANGTLSYTFTGAQLAVLGEHIGKWKAATGPGGEPQSFPEETNLRIRVIP